MDEGAEIGGEGRTGWQPRLSVAVFCPISQEGVILVARGSAGRHFPHTL